MLVECVFPDSDDDITYGYVALTYINPHRKEVRRLTYISKRHSMRRCVFLIFAKIIAKQRTIVLDKYQA